MKGIYNKTRERGIKITLKTDRALAKEFEKTIREGVRSPISRG